MKSIALFIAISLTLFAGSSFGFGLGDLKKAAGGESSSSSSGGVSISAVLDTYANALYKVNHGQKLMKLAAEGKVDQGNALAEKGVATTSNADADIVKANVKEVEANDKFFEDTDIDLASMSADQKELYGKGASAYLLAVPDLIKLSKQVKDVKKPGFSDVANLGKFKLITTIPKFVGNVLSIAPNLLSAGKEADIPMNSKVDTLSF